VTSASHVAAKGAGARVIWVSVAVACAGLSASVVLWRALLTLERDKLTAIAESEAASAGRDVEANLQGYVETLIGVGQRTGARLHEKRQWQISVKGLSATMWVEPSGRVAWVTPPQGHEDLANLDLSASPADREALLASTRSGRPTVTPSLPLPRDGFGFHLVVPVYDKRKLEGFLVGVFLERSLYSALLHPGLAAGWAVAVFAGDREVARRGAPVDERWLAASTATLLDQRWRVRVGVTSETLARLQSPLPQVAFAAGSVIAVLFAVSVGLAQSARRRAREAKRAAALLQQSEEQYRLLFESNPQPMWVYDEGSLGYLAVNDAAIRHYGYSREEFLAMTLREIRPPEEVQALEQHGITRRERQHGAFRSLRVWKHRKKDGTLIDVEIAASPMEFQGRRAWLALANDITEKSKLEAQFLQAQKLESAGRLAGGVAHDFNNLLGVIIGYGELVRGQLREGDASRDRVSQILKAAERAAGLTRQLLAFSRQQVLQPRVLDLNRVVAEIEPMLTRLIGEDVQLETTFAERLGPVKADPGQMEQVIMNLVVNARDAMPRGGRLTIETANAELDAAFAGPRPGLEPGPYVMLAVSDTGLGMEPEVLQQIFEPFFTTKGAGKGTGLGLPTVHGIVKQSGGHLFVYSEVGRGSTFKIYLPRLEGATEHREPVVESQPQRGCERILLVEDEESLRSLVRECLEASGYSVVEARRGVEALELAARSNEPIQLLLTDVVMPGMSGRELAEQIAVSRPEIKVLYMSGYTDDAVVRHGVLTAEMAFLQKPFNMVALASKVRAVLDGTSGASPGSAG